jgi:hypothetical protein
MNRDEDGEGVIFTNDGSMDDEDDTRCCCCVENGIVFVVDLL